MSGLTVFSVSSGRALDSIRHILGREIKAWEDRGIRIRVQESLTGDLLAFRCEIPRAFDSIGQEIMDGVKDAVASGLSHVIIDEYERVLVQRLIEDNYAYLTERDREVLRRKVLLRLNGREGLKGMKKGFAERSRRKSRVWAKLAEYLERENQIVLEGFITFRLKEYLEDLFDTVEQVAEDYLTEREYHEFLKLLRHFMRRQKEVVREVNVVRSGGVYEVLDDKMLPVRGEVGKFLEKPPGGIDLGADDLVVSAVVTLAPERLVWHGPEEGSPCFDLLRDLLEDRMVTCPGCEFHPRGPEPSPEISPEPWLEPSPAHSAEPSSPALVPVPTDSPAGPAPPPTEPGLTPSPDALVPPSACGEPQPVRPLSSPALPGAPRFAACEPDRTDVAIVLENAVSKTQWNSAAKRCIMPQSYLRS